MCNGLKPENNYPTIIRWLWYTENVHKPFYASGFLYHSPSQQILLQQSTHNQMVTFDLFRGKNKNGNDPKTVFRQCVEKALKTTISEASVHTIYDYVHSTLGDQYVFYVEITDQIPTSYKTNTNPTWMLLSKLGKFTMNEQTRHDILIGERVIRSNMPPVVHPQ
jgi:hypothetical protein